MSSQLERKAQAELTLPQRMASASVGALLTSLLVTPLDVVKTRLQTQVYSQIESTKGSMRGMKDMGGLKSLKRQRVNVKENLSDPITCPKCNYYILRNGLMDHWLPKSFLLKSSGQQKGWDRVEPAVEDSLRKLERANFKMTCGSYRKDLFGNSKLTTKAGAGSGNVRCPCVRMMCSNDVFEIRKTMLTPTSSKLSSTLSVTNMLQKQITGEMAAVSTATDSLAASTQQVEGQIRGTIGGLRSILRNEGLTGLYTGLRPTLAMAIPATVLYFAAYDYLTLKVKQQRDWSTGSIALVCGSTARTFSGFAIAPLELLRTKMQAANFEQVKRKLWSASVNQSTLKVMQSVLAHEVKVNGMSGLWRGFFPTLLRDVPFSAIYWYTVETVKERLRASSTSDVALPRSSTDEIQLAFVSGAVGGMIAAALTIPFDVIKTRRQVFDSIPEKSHTVYCHKHRPTSDPAASHALLRKVVERLVRNKNSSFQIAKSIYSEQGAAGFYTGLLPRVAKVVPSCAIMLSSYEAGKQIFLSTS